MKALLVAICVWLSGPGQVELPTEDELPKWPERQIVFEKLDEPVVVALPPTKPGTAWPRWAAAFEVTVASSPGNTRFRQDVDTWVLETRAAEGLSQEQRRLVRNADTVRGVSRRSKVPGTATLELRVHAVSEQDARLMTRAVVEWLESSPRVAFEIERRKLKSSIAALQGARTELAQFLREQPHPAAELEKISQSVWYSSAEEAEEDIRALEKAMRAVELDIAGITAKTEAIQKHMQARTGPSVREALQRLLIEQDVEMAGAMARKAALRAHLNQAREYVRAVQAQARHAELLTRIKQLEHEIDTARESLRTLPGFLAPPQLAGPVRIQPIKYPDGLAE